MWGRPWRGGRAAQPSRWLNGRHVFPSVTASAGGCGYNRQRLSGSLSVRLLWCSTRMSRNARVGAKRRPSNRCKSSMTTAAAETTTDSIGSGEVLQTGRATQPRQLTHVKWVTGPSNRFCLYHVQACRTYSCRCTVCRIRPRKTLRAVLNVRNVSAVGRRCDADAS